MAGDFLRDEQQVSEQGLIFGERGADVDDFLFRNHQHVRRCLRADVGKRDAEFIFVEQFDGDFFVDDALEDGGHIH